MTINKATIKKLTENGLVTEYHKTSFDQVIDENSNKPLNQILDELMDERDFTNNPIDLSSEITAKLPKSNIQLPNSSDISFEDIDGNIISNKLNVAIVELYQLASKGKELATDIGFNATDTYSALISQYQQLFNNIKQILTDKYVDTSTTTKLSDIPSKISELVDVVEFGGFNTVVEEVTVTPYTKEIQLNNTNNVTNAVTSLSEFNPTTKKYTLANSSDFVWNYDETTNKIIYTINKQGVYMFNWID